MASNAPYIVYILKCSDESYYVGSTRSLERRLADHNAGRAAKWTSERKPIVLVYSEAQADELAARKREAQIKRWSRVKKEKLVQGIWRQQSSPR